MEDMKFVLSIIINFLVNLVNTDGLLVYNIGLLCRLRDPMTINKRTIIISIIIFQLLEFKKKLKYSYIVHDFSNIKKLEKIILLLLFP